MGDTAHALDHVEESGCTSNASLLKSPKHDGSRERTDCTEAAKRLQTGDVRVIVRELHDDDTRVADLQAHRKSRIARVMSNAALTTTSGTPGCSSFTMACCPSGELCNKTSRAAGDALRPLMSKHHWLIKYMCRMIEIVAAAAVPA